MQDTNKPTIEPSQEFVVPTQPTVNPLRPTFSTIESTGAPKKSRTKLFLILAGVFALLVAGGVVAFLYVNNQPKTEEKPAVKTLSELNDTLRSVYKDDQSAVSIMIAESGNALAVVQKMNTHVWISADDGAPELGLKLTRSEVDANKADYDTIAGRLAEYGLTETYPGTTTQVLYDAKATIMRYFASDYLVCNLKNASETIQSVSGDTATQFVLSVDCSEKAKFATNSSAFEPFVAAYASRAEADTKDVIIQRATVQLSGVKDYNNADVRIAELANPWVVTFGKFYQTTDKAWHFLAASETADGVPCEEFSTIEQQSAFIGTPCWDKAANKSSFVNVPQIPGPEVYAPVD